jgi:tetratricopeptide (TPR) repeat protein
MPHADPESSFEVAARHLFRHVNDLDALRRNPLARFVFDNTDEDGEGPVGLVRLHARIIGEASTLHDELTGDEARARRRHAIVVGLCNGESPDEAAARVGLSKRQYYRERRSICTHVSRALLSAMPKPSAVASDPLRFLLVRAEALVDQGCGRRAVTLLEDASARMQESSARCVVRLELARALAALENDAPKAALPGEYSELDEYALHGQDTGWLSDRAALARALLALETGGGRDAGRALETLVKRWLVEQRATEEMLDALIECGNWYCQTGRAGDAQKMLRHVRAVARELRHPSVIQRIAIELLGARCTEDSADEFALEHRHLADALSLSTSNGSAKGALSAICALTVHYASIGLDGEAYALAEHGLRIARTTDGNRHLEAVAIHTVVGFIVTRHWRNIAPLLFEAERLTRAGSLSWAILKHVQGSYLTRVRRYDRARTALERARDAAASLGNNKLEAVVLRKLAIALRHLGSVDKSVEYMERSVEMSEQYGTGNTLYRTYDAAARLLPDRRIARLATESKAAMLRRAAASRCAAHGELPLEIAARYVSDFDGNPLRSSVAAGPGPGRLVRFVPFSLEATSTI